jgi:hypothetical protein
MRTLIFSSLIALAAQTSSGLAGMWTLDPAGRGGRGNFAGYATATRMVIAESAAEVTIQTNTGTENQLVTATYRLDGSENPVPGPLGWDTRASATRQNGALVVTIKRSIDGPEGKLNFEIRDVYSVTGNELILERSQGSRTQKAVYKRGG